GWGERGPAGGGVEAEEDVREGDRGAASQLLDRHDRHLGCGVGRLAELEEAQLLADGAVLRLVASRLPHEPYGRVRCDLAPARGEKRRGAPAAGAMRRGAEADTCVRCRQAAPRRTGR